MSSHWTFEDTEDFPVASGYILEQVDISANDPQPQHFHVGDSETHLTISQDGTFELSNGNKVNVFNLLQQVDCLSHKVENLEDRLRKLEKATPWITKRDPEINDD